jgi:hypothetical protein
LQESVGNYVDTRMVEILKTKAVDWGWGGSRRARVRRLRVRLRKAVRRRIVALVSAVPGAWRALPVFGWCEPRAEFVPRPHQG